MNNLILLDREPNLRKAWDNEAKDFTPWLANNLPFLSKRIGIELSHIETESHVGSYYADIVCSVYGTDEIAIIENQLGYTDHDHLGKLITYASGKDARYVIWITAKAKDEYIKAIQWLNEHTDIDFLLVEVELWKLHDGFAPNFHVIERPVGWGKRVEKIPNEKFYSRFWERFNEIAENIPEFIAADMKADSISRHNYYDIPIPSPAIISLTAYAKRKRVSAGLYIRNDIDFYEKLLNSSAIFDEVVGEDDIEWRDEAKKARSIRIFGNFDITDSSEVDKAIEWLCIKASKLKQIAISI